MECGSANLSITGISKTIAKLSWVKVKKSSKYISFSKVRRRRGVKYSMYKTHLSFFWDYLVKERKYFLSYLSSWAKLYPNTSIKSTPSLES